MTDPGIAPGSPDLLEGGRLTPAAWGWRDILAVLGLLVVLLALIVTAEGLLVDAMGIRSGHPGRLTGLGLLLTLVLELCFLALALGFSVGEYGLPWSRFGFTSFPWWGWLLPPLGILGSYAILIIYAALVTALHLHGLLPKSNVPDSLFSYRNLVPFGGIEICLVAPIAEESFFRGFLFHGLLGKWVSAPRSTLRHRLGFLGAALPSGILFAVLHVQPGLLIPFTAIGMLFAWIFWRSGSLWPNIMTHASFNLISFGTAVATHHH